MGNKISLAKNNQAVAAAAVPPQNNKKKPNSNSSDKSLRKSNSSERRNGNEVVVEASTATSLGFDNFINSAVNRDEICDRLTTYHFALKALWESNVLSKKILENVDFDSEDTQVLDIGCGSGNWITDMATEYPHAQFTGLDKAQLYPESIRPKNVQFGKFAQNYIIQFPDNTFDLVQLRMFVVSIKKHEYDPILKEVFRVTKPGGYVQLLECVIVDKNAKQMAEAFAKVETYFEREGFDPSICLKLSDMLSKARFDVVHEEMRFVPLKGHKLSEEFTGIAKCTMEIFRPFIAEIMGLKTKKDYENLMEWVTKTRSEHSRSTWHTSVGRKPLNQINGLK